MKHFYIGHILLVLFLLGKTLAHDVGQIVTVDGCRHRKFGEGAFGLGIENEKSADENFTLLSPFVKMNVSSDWSFMLAAQLTDEFQNNLRYEAWNPSVEYHCHLGEDEHDAKYFFHIQGGAVFAREHEEEHEDHLISAIHPHGSDMCYVNAEADYIYNEKNKFTAGLVAAYFNEHDECKFGMQLSYLHQFSECNLVKIRWAGDFDINDYQELAGYFYHNLNAHTQLSAGVAVGLNDTSPERVIQLGITREF